RLVESRASRVDQPQAELREALLRSRQHHLDALAQKPRRRLEVQLARPRVAPQHLVHGEALLVVVLGGPAVVRRDREAQRGEARGDRSRRQRGHEPHPGLAVPGPLLIAHRYLTRNTERSRTRTPGSSTALTSNSMRCEPGRASPPETRSFT